MRACWCAECDTKYPAHCCSAPQTLLTFTGHGNESTPSFTSTGDFTVSWVYSGNVDTSTGTATPDNFSAAMNTSGQGEDIAFNRPNDIQASGSGNQTVSGDNGSHHFTVQANDAKDLSPARNDDSRRHATNGNAHLAAATPDALLDELDWSGAT